MLAVLLQRLQLDGPRNSVMFLEHRMRAFQGTFHANPDYALRYGWSEMRRDLAEIKEAAAQLRKEHGPKP